MDSPLFDERFCAILELVICYGRNPFERGTFRTAVQFRPGPPSTPCLPRQDVDPGPDRFRRGGEREKATRWAQAVSRRKTLNANDDVYTVAA